MATLNYNHLRYFWTVARDGRLTRAARALHLSQSALSAQIKKLEEQLGHPLFERRGRTLELTEAGRIAFDHAEAIFAAGEELMGRLNLTATGARQRLRVGALATLSRNFQLSFLSPILREPGVELTLRSGSLPELLADLEAHRLDVLLANQTPARDGGAPWTAHIVDDQPVSLVGAPHLVEAVQGAGEARLRALLRAHPVVAPSTASGVRTGFDALLQRWEITPAIAAEVDDMAMMRLLAREGMGLAVLPPIVVRDELETGELIDAGILPSIHEVFVAITLQRRFPNPLLGRLLR